MIRRLPTIAWWTTAALTDLGLVATITWTPTVVSALFTAVLAVIGIAAVSAFVASRVAALTRWAQRGGTSPDYDIREEVNQWTGGSSAGSTPTRTPR